MFISLCGRLNLLGDLSERVGGWGCLYEGLRYALYLYIMDNMELICCEGLSVKMGFFNDLDTSQRKLYQEIG